MNRFCKYMFCVIACASGSLHPHTVRGADPGANTAELNRIQLKSNEARLTFTIKIEDPNQPVLLELDRQNNVPAVVNSITVFPTFTTLQLEGTEGAADVSDRISVKFPGCGNYELSLLDATFIVKPQYKVIATLDTRQELRTRVHAQLLVTVRKPFKYSLSQATMTFKEGGVDRKIPVSTFNFNGSTTYPDEIGIPVTQNLAYWVNDSDFPSSDTSKSKAMAQLQFPMRGNWPSHLTLPGTIEFVYFTVPALLIKEAEFAATIAKDFQNLDSQVKISRESGPQFTSDPDSSWPRLNYLDKLTYKTKRLDKLTFKNEGKVFVRTNRNTPTIAPGIYGKPATVSLITAPGQESSADLDRLNSILGKLARQDDSLMALNKILNATIPVLKKHEIRIQFLNDSHVNLVHTSGVSDEDLRTSRAKLESAKRAAAAIVEAYNAAVMSYPD
jgi:hypothetical protein